jgi:hypothetical protein
MQQIGYVFQIRLGFQDAPRSSTLRQRRPSFDLGQNEDAGLQQGEVFCNFTLASPFNEGSMMAVYGFQARAQ